MAHTHTSLLPTGGGRCACEDGRALRLPCGHLPLACADACQGDHWWRAQSCDEVTLDNMCRSPGKGGLANRQWGPTHSFWDTDS